jgi:mannose-1-phosphate guanylyltransferase / mannose-6-phosphate isomerase
MSPTSAVSSSAATPLASGPVSYVPVVLCGGSGTRLWPLSRNGMPKQFLVLHGNQSLFQMAVDRLLGLADATLTCSAPLIVTNEAHRFMVADQLRELVKAASAQQLLEPEGRNTAPAITLAALVANQTGHDPVLVVSPADQIVTDLPAFTTALRSAVRRAATGALVVLGVPPTRPETGFGYIRHQGKAGSQGEFVVAQFAEKPDLETAKAYVQSGEYLWNGGMFVVRASVWLEAMAAFAPEILQSVEQSFEQAKSEPHALRPGAEAFLASPSISADYAVIEKCPGSQFPIEVVPLDAGWNDLGAWDAVWQIGEKDPNGNVTHGDVLTVDTQNTLVHAEHRFVGTVGINDLVIVETADAVLVGHRDQAQQVKAIVQSLSAQKRDEHLLHRKVHRPWGWYDSIDEDRGFKVKRIMVKPGASLSLQKHHHRAEHWIVVSGVAEVTCGQKVSILNVNESTFIPQGEVHRLANPGKIPLEIIEVQSGSYLGEDDIVRFEDHYGRTSG